jgi:hypothetical protein
VRHAKVFADFWLGMAVAGAEGVAEALEKETSPSSSLFEHAVDRSASAILAALERAKDTALKAEEDLTKIHSTKRPDRTARKPRKRRSKRHP